ncbi:hypothetical protein HC928_00140 [bacterium]|nr:hypothetical protein [bacterium]
MQGTHALVQFVLDYPIQATKWHEISDHLCFLAVANEQQLQHLVNVAKQQQISCSTFFESDFGDALTTVVLDATPSSSKLVANLKLALKSALVA